MKAAGATAALGTARVYWQGAHATHLVSGRPFQSPLGKLHAEGLALLGSAGWTRVPAADPRVPGFALTTRKGADFPAAGAGLPAVRQFPQRCTAVLDDKRLLAECLEAEGCPHLAPRTWPDAESFLHQHSASTTAQAPADWQLAAGGSRRGLWFLKHRHGVKGQAVHPFTSLPPLLERLRSLGGGGGGGGGRQQWVVQEGVSPPLLLPDGRKFMLRAHVLLLLLGSSRQEQAQGQPQAQPAGLAGAAGAAGQLAAWVHRDVIVTPHARPLCQPAAGAGEAAAGAADPAVHVSSRGSSHPRPYLLSELRLGAQQQLDAEGQRAGQQRGPGEPWETGSGSLQRQLWHRVCEISAAAVAAAARRGLVPGEADQRATLYHLLAFDFGVADAAAAPPPDPAGQPSGQGAAAATPAAGAVQPPRQPQVLLLEANSYPAIASGTMAAVPRAVYTRLMADLLSLVVLPGLRRAQAAEQTAAEQAAAEPEAPQEGGFCRVL
ncbi:hypothetical protein CHLNCDRAFT_57891 [Chlorella variabilis]|uniref:Tubulin-tyrosine ligase n=1 Tax=Chlorella variabilis TaxID=554065 RepID=E1ZEZ3_CHLVA|nr:hypothetical protein CHLNCDRAFT_57891 [Chlorella variabilis]EFN55580.1 hypothetical protein CHLNCDRAFT_57891 [Chlorella variabilis]|eukprot:XP_005847682.1 hypothetical protein CHLNCDRAFT_57891 [Chlorella variabilis]